VSSGGAEKSLVHAVLRRKHLPALLSDAADFTLKSAIPDAAKKQPAPKGWLFLR